ncbi:helix-turn-helix domain-containing protein [Streptomyces sp. NPDC020489]|uniref:helix-turn-helix domain-containing protein n=1 Tax=Streptomyces sp. NPDC020489 TaxID=3365077 RepID=UPI00378AB6A4
MGRRENPIAQCSKSLQALAAWLRAGRTEAGLTYDQLATRTEFSADTLARAASGRSVPQNLAVVTAYARACNRSAKEAERLWKQARRDEARTQGVISGHRGGVHISVVKDFADLHSAIVDLYRDDGSPPLRSLDARLGNVGRLPHSTVARVLKGSSTPSRTFVSAFAEACNVRKADLAEWTKAWDRADADRRNSRMRKKPAGLHRRLTVHNRATPRDLQLLMSDLESSARREPGLKLLVHIPQPGDADPDASARMTRELLVDQAQRSGDLACPECRRPSFGYDDRHGWIPQLCTNCAPPAPDPDTDTPTLALGLRIPPERPPLPQRIARPWPAAETSPAVPQDVDSLATHHDPPTTAAAPTMSPAADFFAPRAFNRPAGTHPGTNQTSADPQPRTDTRLTTRIRINIPGSRPIPPVVIDEAASSQCVGDDQSAAPPA